MVGEHGKWTGVVEWMNCSPLRCSGQIGKNKDVFEI